LHIHTTVTWKTPQKAEALKEANSQTKNPQTIIYKRNPLESKSSSQPTQTLTYDNHDTIQFQITPTKTMNTNMYTLQTSLPANKETQHALYVFAKRPGPYQNKSLWQNHNPT